MTLTDKHLDRLRKSSPDNPILNNFVEGVKLGRIKSIDDVVSIICELASQNEQLKLQIYELHKFGIPNYAIKLEPGTPLPPSLGISASPSCSQPPLKAR